MRIGPYYIRDLLEAWTPPGDMPSTPQNSLIERFLNPFGWLKPWVTYQVAYSVCSVYSVGNVYSVYNLYNVYSVYSVYNVYSVESVYNVYSAYSVQCIQCIHYIQCTWRVYGGI